MLRRFFNPRKYLRAHHPNTAIIEAAPAQEEAPQEEINLFSIFATIAVSACVGCMAQSILRK